MGLFYTIVCLALNMVEDIIPTLLHQPFGRAGSTADSYRLHIARPVHVNLLCTLYAMAIGVHTQALIEEHLTVGTLMTTYKEDKIMPGSKVGEIGRAHV